MTFMGEKQPRTSDFGPGSKLERFGRILSTGGYSLLEKRFSKEVEAIAQKPWSIEMTYDPEAKQYSSLIPELNVASQGSTRQRALNHLEEALRLTVEAMIEAGEELPQPRVYQDELQ